MPLTIHSLEALLQPRQHRSPGYSIQVPEGEMQRHLTKSHSLGSILDTAASNNKIGERRAPTLTRLGTVTLAGWFKQRGDLVSSHRLAVTIDRI